MPPTEIKADYPVLWMVWLVILLALDNRTLADMMETAWFCLALWGACDLSWEIPAWETYWSKANKEMCEADLNPTHYLEPSPANSQRSPAQLQPTCRIVDKKISICRCKLLRFWDYLLYSQNWTIYNSPFLGTLHILYISIFRRSYYFSHGDCISPRNKVSISL